LDFDRTMPLATTRPSLRALREIMIKKVHAETAKEKSRKDRRDVAAGMPLRSLRAYRIRSKVVAIELSKP
jgi:hypothetical protein